MRLPQIMIIPCLQRPCDNKEATEDMGFNIKVPG